MREQEKDTRVNRYCTGSGGQKGLEGGEKRNRYERNGRDATRAIFAYLIYRAATIHEQLLTLECRFEFTH